MSPCQIPCALSMAADPARFPDEVIITDVPDAETSGSNTPAGDEDDFFSSWDKPTIKRPSNPPSRTGTPASGSRTASPFLNASSNGNGTARSKSPLSAGSEATPAAPRAVPASAVRSKTAATSKPKANILGAKKKGLGAKKVVATGGDALDFDEMERKAKEEAERIEKLGYDAEAERVAAEEAAKAKEAESRANIVSPTPVSPRGGFGSTSKDRNSGDVERLGMGVARLGFGQVGSSKPAAAPKKMGGFGSTSRPAQDGTLQTFFFLGLQGACANDLL